MTAKLPEVFKFPAGQDWDGEFWSETLSGKAREQYRTLVEGLMVADREQIPQLARELYNLGHRHGGELAGELNWD